MFQNIFTYLVLALISFFPIVIWAYIFSYIDESLVNKKRFYLGVFGGIISVVPILYIDKIIGFLKVNYLNTFYYISQIKGFVSGLEFVYSLLLFFLIIVIFSFLFGGIIHFFKNIFRLYLKNIFVFLFLIIILSLVIFGLNFGLSGIDFIVGNDASINFGNIIFNSFKLVIFYYILVAFFEETSKHFNFLQSNILQINSIKDGVLYAIFVALGFSFVENILYLYNYYSYNGFDSGLIQIYFFRSVFSIIVHILCSSVVAYYFSKALILYRDKLISFPYIKIFSYGIFISILLHLFYDVALSLGFSIVMFLYFIGGYLYVSSIFYKE